MTEPARPASFRRIAADGAATSIERPVATERPVAVEVDGFGYAVLMATPGDLTDLAYGFALADRLIDGADDVRDIDVHEAERGTIVRITLAPHLAGRSAERMRHRTSDSSCGLCGIENLEQALRPLPQVTASCHATDAAIFQAAADLRDRQPLARATGAVHAAALCGADGRIRLIREDVGRHNAMDKLIGAMRRGDIGWDGGFALLSSRCSYELVEKAALAGCPLLATVSSATTLAIERAAEAGVALRSRVRADAMLAS